MINATEGQRQGYTGAGFRIGFIDTGIDRNAAALAGKVAGSFMYIDPASNDLSVDDKVGHGTAVAQLAVGGVLDDWPGGVAPGAVAMSARIVDDELDGDGRLHVGDELWLEGTIPLFVGIRTALLDMANQGMRIANNSWGGLDWSDPAKTREFAAAYRVFIRDFDGLVTFAAGDGALADPDDMAALPSQPGEDGTLVASDLEQSWLTVAAVDADSGSRLASYSNACGVAANYCLVAPGDVVFTGKADDGATEYRRGGSTAYAAPLVAGAAALVWEKFPYFDSELVRQTLLGTATDLGAEGVDAVFGHGLLNVEKALDGPSRFDWGDVTVRLNGARKTTWKNDIAGTGGLVVDGEGQFGSLILAGKSTFTGSTHVRNGAMLTLLNDFASSLMVDVESDVQLWSGAITGDIEILPGGGLYLAMDSRIPGQRAVHGDIVNRGSMQVGLQAAPLLEGNYTQGAASVLEVYLGDEPLHFSGKADLGNTGALAVRGLAPGYVAHANTEILIADGGVSGSFLQLWNYDANLLLSATFGYGPDRVWLDVTRADVSIAAMSISGITPASLGSAVRVEESFRQIDGQMESPHDRARPIRDDFIAAAGRLQRLNDPDSLAGALRSLSGEVHAAAAAATYDTLDLGRRALSSRFDDLASGGRRAGGWMEVLGGSASLGSGVDAQVDGWLAGHDVALDGAMVAGLAFGESHTDSRINGLADRSRERQTQAQGYLGRHWNRAYVMGQFGAGQWRRQIDRELLLGASRYGVHSDYDGDFAQAGLEAGYRFDGAAGSLVPYLGTEHVQVRSDGFQEQGAAGFGLRTVDSTSSRAQAIAGLRASRDWRRISLSGYAEWQQTLASDGLALSASFVGVDSWSPLAASNPALPGGMVGLQATAWLGTSSTLALGYDQRFGPRGDASLVSLRYAFGF